MRSLLFLGIIFSSVASAQEATPRPEQKKVGDTDVTTLVLGDCKISLSVLPMAHGRVGTLELCERPILDLSQGISELFNTAMLDYVKCPWFPEIGKQYTKAQLADADWNQKTGKLRNKERLGAHATTLYRKTIAGKELEAAINRSRYKVRTFEDGTPGKPKHKLQMNYIWLKDIERNPYLIPDPRCRIALDYKGAVQ